MIMETIPSVNAVRELIKRLTADAHNETGSVRAYARSLLMNLGQPVPPDPEFRPQGEAFPARGESPCAHGGDKIYRGELIKWVEVGRWSHVECIMPESIKLAPEADPWDTVAAPSTPAPVEPTRKLPRLIDFTGGVTGKPGPVFMARYDSECPYGDQIVEGEQIRATGDGEFAHANCMKEAGDVDD
jgi:hypothetical protein